MKSYQHESRKTTSAESSSSVPRATEFATTWPNSPARPSQAPRLTLESRSRKWTLRVVALLMILQAAGLAFMTVVYMSQVNWIRERALPGLSPTAVDTLLFSVLTIPLVLFAARAVLGLVRVRKGAWLQSMAIQALLLVFALSSYVLNAADSLTFWTLGSCIIVVLYLNTHEVRSSFSADAMEKNDPTELFGDEDEDEVETDVPTLPPIPTEGLEIEAPTESVDALPDTTIPNTSSIDKTTIDKTANDKMS